MMCGWSSQPTGMFVPKESKNHLKMYLQMDQNGMFVGCECFVAVFHSSSQSPKSPKINVRLAPLTTGLVLAPECSSTPGRVTAEAVIFFTNRNTKIWTSWLILLVRDSSSPKRWYTPNPLVCLISGQTHLVIHVPSFTSRSSEILLWCLFNIVTWGKKKYGYSHRTNRTQWCETASWKFRATVSGLHMASHVLCVEIWLQMHGIPAQVCPWILRVEAGWEVWGAGSKKTVLIPSHPSSWGAGLVLSRAGRAWRWGGSGPVWTWCHDMCDLRYTSDALHSLSRYLIQNLQLQSKKDLIWT